MIHSCWDYVSFFKIRMFTWAVEAHRAIFKGHHFQKALLSSCPLTIRAFIWKRSWDHELLHNVTLLNLPAVGVTFKNRFPSWKEALYFAKSFYPLVIRHTLCCLVTNATAPWDLKENEREMAPAAPVLMHTVLRLQTDSFDPVLTPWPGFGWGLNCTIITSSI